MTTMAFLTKPILRHTTHFTLLIITLYAFFYFTASEETWAGLPLPGYLKPKPTAAPAKTHGAGTEALAETWSERADAVKRSFKHAYYGYEAYAAPGDELGPISNLKKNNFNGWGVTAIDSLDTMLLMGLKDEYARGLNIVRHANFSTSSQFIPYFETVIRYLGGLLSAYALSEPKDPILLQRAEELALTLDPAFNSTMGLPYSSVDPETGIRGGSDFSILAEIGTLQLEYSYLAKLSGKAWHFNRSETVMRTFESANLTDSGGMLPTGWNIAWGKPSNVHLSVGSMADSTHEYLLKLYLLTGKKDKRSLKMYLRATTQIITQLLFLSPNRNLLYVTDTAGSIFSQPGMASHSFEHLSCFLPGLLALGAHTLPLNDIPALNIPGVNSLMDLGNQTTYGRAGEAYGLLGRYNLRDLHMWAADGLAQSCWLMYADQPTGLGPDEVQMFNTPLASELDANLDTGPAATSAPGKEEGTTHLWIEAVERWRRSGGRGIIPGLKEHKPNVVNEEDEPSVRSMKRDYTFKNPSYLLRPETVESLYLMWRTTGDVKWRERGWSIFKAIEKETKTGSGYTSLFNVHKWPTGAQDSMPSYFLAETLKYLYLMFLDDDPISLDKWVFNTEAHPLPVFDWTEEEKARFKIL